MLAAQVQRAPGPRVAPVGEEGQEEEDGGSDISSADDSGHGFRVDGMSGEQESGHGRRKAGHARMEERTGQTGEEGGGHAVQQHVDQVVTQRVQFVSPEVEAEGQDAQRTVGFVRTGMRQRSAPKVVEQHVDPWRRRLHVRIGLYRSAEKQKQKQKRNGQSFSMGRRFMGL